MKILAIESSCDEFSISIMHNGKILTNIISSQIEQHKLFGGVIPELAARLHYENFHLVLEQAFQQSRIKPEELNFIAYTKTPGLIGSLIIGELVAQTLARYLSIPLLPLNHIEGHIFGAEIGNEFVYPVLAMVVSGGHTQIELLNSPNDFQIIGQTLDDAIGECYDKVGRYLNLPYPAGPIIDKLAQKGNSDKYKLSTPKNDQSYDFSFSGLKTASINLINNLKQKNEPISLEDFCASFQKAAMLAIYNKLKKAIIEFKPNTLTVAGGVSANSSIRKIITSLGKELNVSNNFVPNLEYCTDNAAMMANLAYHKLKLKNFDTN